MALEILTMEQGSEAWHQAKCGIPSASNFSKVLAKGKGLTRRKYLYTLAGERITDTPAEGYNNAHMERGKEMEAEARDHYEFTTGSAVEQIGLMLNHGAAYSPDGLVGDDGLVEFKSMTPSVLIEHIELDRLPPEHVAQCQGGLWVSGRKWLDYRGYWPAMPTLAFRVERDEEYIAETLIPEIEAFNRDLDALIARLTKGA